MPRLSREAAERAALEAAGSLEEMVREATRLVVEAREASTGYLQRAMTCSFARARWLLEHLERRGVVTPAGDRGRLVRWTEVWEPPAGTEIRPAPWPRCANSAGREEPWTR